MSERTEYRKLKANLKETSKVTGQQNKFKKETEKILEEHRRAYATGREKHLRKIEFLKNKYRVKLKEVDRKEARMEWMRRMAEGTGAPPPEHIIPKYGEVSTDCEEDQALMLPPKFNTYPKIQETEAQYESTLTNTKSRWSRMETGGPKEMEDAAREELERNEGEDENRQGDLQATA